MSSKGYEPLNPEGASASVAGKLCVACGCCLSLIGVLWVAVVVYVAIEGERKFVQMPGGRNDKYCEFGVDDVNPENATFNIWWPGCGQVSSMENFSSCGEPCFDEKTMQDMQETMSSLPHKKVFYKSRAAKEFDTVMLGGRWLPADETTFPSPRPRIVLQHGYTTNSNGFRQWFMAWKLRSMGFDVLVNNFRDHCYSGDSKLKFFHWGFSYPYDTLGAWDYAKDDPDGILGGPLDASQVGMVGFSKGGFMVLNAFGLEGQIPAVWVDGAVNTPRKVFRNGVEKQFASMGASFLAPFTIDPAWFFIRMQYHVKHGADLELHLPEKTLPTGPDTARPIQLVQNKHDSTVPVTEGELNKELIESLPEKYSLKGYWLTEELCNGDDHCTDHLSQREEYAERTCAFWSKVFGTSSCSVPEAKDAKADTEADKAEESKETRRLRHVHI